MRRIRYIEIADVMRQRIAKGEYSAGQVLESESDLSGSFEASRMTIRRALEELRGEGLVDSRQGFGWFVAADPLRQSLAQLGTIEQQLSDSGLSAERRILDFAFVQAAPHIAEILGTDEVLKVRRMNDANGRPFARVTVWCPAELAAELSRGDVEREPFVRLLDVELGGAQQTIAAALVEPEDAALLQIPEGSPVLRCERVTHDVDGEAVLVSEHIFPGHLTEFRVDLPSLDDSISPSGLRLVE